jgi:hypothetical protein
MARSAPHVIRVDIAGDPFSAGIDPSRLPEMERHFYFTTNDEGQQESLASVLAGAFADPDAPRERVLTVTPGE